MQETELRNPKTKNIDKADVRTTLELINEENAYSVKAVEKAIPQIEKAVELVITAFKKGGRLIYVGCGTSGRLAMADSAECPPTFGASPDTVVTVMAGGLEAVRRPSETTEDSHEQGVEDISQLNLNENDVVMGISAGGNADYVVGAMQYAKGKGCKLISLSSNSPCKIGELAEVEITTRTGAEVITGSTRMKAGNAQKMVLNMISTTAMIKTGKVYQNLMVNLRPTNIKLRKRMTEVVKEVYSVSDEKATAQLEQYDYDITAMLEKNPPQKTD